MNINTNNYNITTTKAFRTYTYYNIENIHYVCITSFSVVREILHLCGKLLFVLLEATNSTQYRQKNISI
jgi:hypothetical protein